MNHAKPTDPDEMYGTNETKKLRRRKGRGGGRWPARMAAYRQADLVRLWLDSPGRHTATYTQPQSG